MPFSLSLQTLLTPNNAGMIDAGNELVLFTIRRTKYDVVKSSHHNYGCRRL
jgi:hypothetical protein